MVSAFDIFKVGIGPSSSHTMGPMRAARTFATGLDGSGQLIRVQSLTVDLFGSLAATGQGHGTDTAILLGLEGEQPESVDVSTIASRVARIRGQRAVEVLRKYRVPFAESEHLHFRHGESLDAHPNGMRFTAQGDGLQLSEEFFSIGGGFVVGPRLDAHRTETTLMPLPFNTAEELLAQCRTASLRIPELMMRNECVSRTEDAVTSGLLDIWDAMQQCAHRGITTEETRLPGPLKVKRRAPHLDHLFRCRPLRDPLAPLDRVAAVAIAINEENAAGGRVVTAPTNGAAGLLPAVLHYYVEFIPSASDKGICDFLLTAAAIGGLYKRNASISGAEVGCQGEVGVACSMAAAGLVAAMRGSNEQIEHAAEIGMEHHLGMTCDPVGGLVQIPCIERNSIGATKAIAASRLALAGDGQHVVSLDRVIETMRQTGRDMQVRYKETSLGGLALNVVEC